MNLTGTWLVTRVQTDSDRGAMRIIVHLYSEAFDTEQLGRIDRTHSESRVNEVVACREEGDAEPRWGWTSRDVSDDWVTRLDIDGTDAMMQRAEARKVETLETDGVQARCVLRCYGEAQLARILVSRVGCPQLVVSERVQGELLLAGDRPSTVLAMLEEPGATAYANSHRRAAGGGS